MTAVPVRSCGNQAADLVASMTAGGTSTRAAYDAAQRWLQEAPAESSKEA